MAIRPSRNGVSVAATAGEIALEWAELAERSGAPPFLHPGWIKAWLDAFCRGSISILTARSDGRLVAVLPLLQRFASLRSPTNWHTPLFGAVSEDRQAAERLVVALLARRYAYLDLSFLNADDPLITGLLELKGARTRAISRPALRSPYLALDGDWASFEAGMSSNMRRQLGRARRRLDQAGDVRVELADGGERLDALLDEGFAVEGSGWKLDRGTAIVSRPEVERFYRSVARWAAERGWLRLGFLRLDGRCVAFNMSLAAGGVVYSLKAGFDTAYRKASPGMLLKRAQIADAFDTGMTSYEFLGDETAHKLRWASGSRERRRIQVFAPSAAGYAAYGAWRHGRPLAQTVLARLAPARHP